MEGGNSLLLFTRQRLNPATWTPAGDTALVLGRAESGSKLPHSIKIIRKPGGRTREISSPAAPAR